MNMTAKKQKRDIFLADNFRLFFDLLVSKIVFHVQDRHRLHHLFGALLLPIDVKIKPIRPPVGGAFVAGIAVSILDFNMVVNQLHRL